MKHLHDGYYLKSLSKEEFIKAQGNTGKEVFSKEHYIFPNTYLSDQEKDNISHLNKEMNATPFSLHLVIFDKDDNFVAWSYGFQENAHNYYMCNSGVVESHRRKGLYTLLLNETVKIVSEKGFQVIYSRHNATNNSVIIPKLKAGFTISNFELSDMFGVLVHLKFYTNPTRRKINDYRSGQLAPDEQINSLFKRDH